MLEEEKSFTAADGKKIVYHRWLPEKKEVRGVFQIIHGMAEHSLRYRWFASVLTDQGYAVYADDHRGHGKTAGSREKISHLEPGDAERMIEDEGRLTALISTDFPARPIVIFAHSMGSLIGRVYLGRFGSKVHAAVICGTAYKPAPVRLMARAVAWSQMKLLGARHRSPFLTRLTFGAYNRYFEKRTLFDWLTRDQEEVDRFIADAQCGQLCTTGFFYTLFTLVSVASEARTIRSTPRDLPLFFIAGDKDPVGGYGKEIKELNKAFQNQGFKDTSLKLYAGARHELTNEINRDEVVDDLLHWLSSRPSFKDKTR